jgi:ATP-dependent DNA helicase RecG
VVWPCSIPADPVDDPLYPPPALREALANALCHWDYAAAGGSVSIAIFDDRIEIASTGALLFGLKPDDLLRPHGSRPWNPLVAQTFFRRGIIEQWGRAP